MPGWLVPVITGLAATGGSMMANQTNRGISREQMKFQERMSSTAAQRAVEDYRKAGLNPALAYDRPASSPGGAAIPAQDVIGAGISSGRDAARLRQELVNMSKVERLTDAQISKTRFEARQAEMAAKTAQNTQEDAEETLRQQLRTQRALLPFDQMRGQAEAELLRAQVPGAFNEAAVQEMLGKGGPLMKLFSPLLRLIRPR